MMSKPDDIHYHHFIDKSNSITELIQIHLIECPISDRDIIVKLQRCQDIITEIKDDVKKLKDKQN